MIPKPILNLVEDETKGLIELETVRPGDRLKCNGEYRLVERGVTSGFVDKCLLSTNVGLTVRHGALQYISAPLTGDVDVYAHGTDPLAFFKGYILAQNPQATHWRFPPAYQGTLFKQYIQTYREYPTVESYPRESSGTYIYSHPDPDTHIAVADFSHRTLQDYLNGYLSAGLSITQGIIRLPMAHPIMCLVYRLLGLHFDSTEGGIGTVARRSANLFFRLLYTGTVAGMNSVAHSTDYLHRTFRTCLNGNTRNPPPYIRTYRMARAKNSRGVYLMDFDPDINTVSMYKRQPNGYTPSIYIRRDGV